MATLVPYALQNIDTKQKGKSMNSKPQTELERARLHGPDTRTLDALQSTLERAEVAERDFIQVHKNCIEARAASDRLRTLLRELLKFNIDSDSDPELFSLLDRIERELSQTL